MTVNTRELIEAVSTLTDDHNIRVTVKSSLKASAVVGASTFFGAMVRKIKEDCEICIITELFSSFQLMGPFGILFGAVTGGLGSYFMAQGETASDPDR